MPTGKLLFFLLLVASVLMSTTCSKTSNSSNAHNTYNSTPAIFSYTVTDTLGARYIFADTSIAKDTIVFTANDSIVYQNNEVPGNPSPLGFVFPANIPVNPVNLVQYVFTDSKTSSLNQLRFYLPYYKFSLSQSNQLGNSPIFLVLNNTNYNANTNGNQGNNVGLSSININTNIGDSTGGVCSGTFTMALTTYSSATLYINGTFSNIPIVTWQF